jgi:hypothetical protein
MRGSGRKTPVREGGASFYCQAIPGIFALLAIHFGFPGEKGEPSKKREP